MAPTRHQAIDKVLSQLRGHLGLGETPPGSNHNMITEWYNEYVARIGDGPWCQMTDTWSVWTAGFKQLLTGTAYTVYAAQNAEKKLNGSSWHPGVKGMRHGDQVYYDWQGGKAIAGVDHTGTVEHVNSDGTFYVLEGNASDKLVRVKRDKTYVVGYVRLDWDRVSVQHKPTPKPVKASPAVLDHPIVPAKKPVDEVKLHPHISEIQKAVGVPVTGVWDSVTDTAVLKFREKHRQKKK